mmetsp:Transcript_17756/g.24356  ORF Transcript_17756/g.24356 Transcript_17756/m.24356 type:complete len:94 (+) Transcript_17756:9-290(+)
MRRPWLSSPAATATIMLALEELLQPLQCEGIASFLLVSRSPPTIEPTNPLQSPTSQPSYCHNPLNSYCHSYHSPTHQPSYCYWEIFVSFFSSV